MRVYTLGMAEKELSDSATDLLDGVLSPNTTILYGAAGIGKGRIVAGMIAAGLGGQPYAGREWSHTLERVAIVSTDAGGGSEYVRALRRYGVGIMQDEAVRIAIPEHVPSSQEWAEWSAATLAWKPSLVVVDSTTEAVRGSLNDDQAVRQLWTDLAPIHDPIAGAPLLLVHHVSKPTAESRGRAGTTPIGSGLWEAYSRAKVLVRKAGGEGETGDVTLECRPRYGPMWRSFFTWEEPTDGEKVARLLWTGEQTADEIAERRQRRRADRDGLNIEVVEFVVSECQGLNATQTAKAIAKRWPKLGKPETIRQNLSRGRDYGGLLKRDGGTWTRVA